MIFFLEGFWRVLVTVPLTLFSLFFSSFCFVFTVWISKYTTFFLWLTIHLINSNNIILIKYLWIIFINESFFFFGDVHYVEIISDSSLGGSDSLYLLLMQCSKFFYMTKQTQTQTKLKNTLAVGATVNDRHLILPSPIHNLLLPTGFRGAWHAE